jgi:hypothetical protein
LVRESHQNRGAGLLTGSTKFAVKEIEVFEIPGIKPRRPREPDHPLPPPSGFASSILNYFPVLFADFASLKFNLLWHGSRDGFGAADFHSRCDGHANTLTLICDTDGNIFGGFTPVRWESFVGSTPVVAKPKADSGVRGFLFTLVNPQNFPPRQFPLLRERKDWAVSCRLADGPCFHSNLRVCDNCNANGDNVARFDGAHDSYAYEREFPHEPDQLSLHTEKPARPPEEIPDRAQESGLGNPVLVDHRSGLLS